MHFYRDWFRFIRAVVAICPWPSLLLVVATVVTGLQPAAEFWALRPLIDQIVDGLSAQMDWKVVTTSLLIFGGISMAGSMIRRIFPYLWELLRQDAERVMEEQLLEQAGSVPLAEMEAKVFHERFSLARDGMKLQIFPAIEGTQRIVAGIITLFSALAVLLTTHWAVAAILATVAVPIWILNYRLTDLYYSIWRQHVDQRRRSDYFADLLTQRRAAQEIRLFGLATELINRWRDNVRTVLEQTVGLLNRTAITNGVAGLIAAAAYVVAVGLMGSLTAAGQLTIGALAAAIRVGQQFQAAILEVTWQLAILRRIGSFFSDYWSFIDISAPAATVDAQVPEGMAGSVRPVSVAFSNVSFGYPGSSAPALKEISFEVKPGQLVALVGENGVGKSTLVKLILGLYQPTEGSLRVDGHDPSASENGWLRARFAPVFQDFLHYSLTAGENVGIGDTPGVCDQRRIETAATASGADLVVQSLPRGYGTILGKEWEGGAELSGGQWQKLAIARSYMRRAALIVLDEPTAALDPQAELEVFRRFQELAKGKTAFLISHRLGAARLADRILVLNEGRLFESGNHDELMALGGEYATLFEAQAHWYR